MKSRVKKKRIAMVLLCIIIIIIFLFKMPHNYKIHYNIDKTKIEEEYNKKLKIHYLKVEKDSKDYEFVVSTKWQRKIVTGLDYYVKDNIKCLSLKLKEENLRPICYDNKTIKDVELINNEDILKHYKIKNTNKDNNTTFNNVTIYNQDNSAFLLWNYRGFDYLNGSITDNIKITDKDVYNLNIITKIDNLVILADYSQDYHFTKFIIINLENGKKQTWDIDYDISMDSYILGSYDKSVYLVDKKSLIEYEIVPSHKKIRIVGTKTKKGVIYNNDFEDISLNKLVKKEYSFKQIKGYNYEAFDDKLYLKLYNSPNKILVTRKDDIKIVDIYEDSVYYLSGSKLYRYNTKDGEKLLLEDFEWNFNNQNMIFVMPK